MAGPIFTAEQRDELFGLVRDRSFKTGNFTLASGKQSNLYFNLKPTMMHARGAELVARALLDILLPLKADYISGLEMGAVPAIGSVAALSSALGQPINTTFVRKKAKEHGTQQQVEGLGPDEDIAGKHVVVIDDVSTTGGSTLKAIEAVRAAGGIVTHAACLLNRGEGGDELMAEHGITLHSVFRSQEFVA